MRIFYSVTFVCYCVVAFSQSNFCGTTFNDERTSLELLDQYPQATRKDAGYVYIPLMVHSVGNDKSLGFYAPWSLFETLLINADPMLLIEFEDKYRFFLEKLTPREKEVLELLSEGKSVEVIAAMLGISVGAVGNIITRIKNEFNDFFGLKSR